MRLKRMQLKRFYQIQSFTHQYLFQGHYFFRHCFVLQHINRTFNTKSQRGTKLLVTAIQCLAVAGSLFHSEIGIENLHFYNQGPTLSNFKTLPTNLKFYRSVNGYEFANDLPHLRTIYLAFYFMCHYFKFNTHGLYFNSQLAL